jgi:hypothetical protein
MKDHFSRNVTALFVNVHILFCKILYELELGATSFDRPVWTAQGIKTITSEWFHFEQFLDL